MKLEDKKRMAAKAFAAFFILMAAAGGLSRAAASMTVPIADTQKYQSGRLNLNLTGTAVVETKEENLVSLVKEQRILSTARIGTQVEQGDVLLQYDTQYLQKAIEEKQAEALLDTALELGCNFFDHADIYGQGACESRFAQAIHMSPSVREKIILQSRRFSGKSEIPGTQ